MVEPGYIFRQRCFFAGTDQRYPPACVPIPAEPAFWGDTDFIRGPVYYLVYAWMSVLFLTILVIAFMRCAVPANRKRIWIPAVPLLIGAVYTLGVILGPEETVTGFLTVPEMGCFLFASFIESLICVHLFPSNDRYGEFFLKIFPRRRHYGHARSDLL